MIDREREQSIEIKIVQFQKGMNIFVRCFLARQMRALSRLPGYAQLVPGASKLRTETRKTQTEEGNSKAIEDTTQQEC